MFGFTALHFACVKDGVSPTVISLLGRDRRCTPIVLNKKDNGGDSPLMLAVMFGNLESLREMEKLEGTNFHTKNSYGEGLVDVARRVEENYGQEKCMAVLEYLLNRKKVESLKEMAAHSVARLLSSEDDVEKLDVPLILQPLVAGMMDTVRNTENDDDSDGSDDESDGSDDESDESDEEEEEEEEEEMA